MQRHGIAIGVERANNQVMMTLTLTGKLTHQDYELITPMLEQALSGVAESSVRMLVDASQFHGWELAAVWDDFKFGVKHHRDFGKIAVFGKPNWPQWVASISSWFISGEVKFFEDEIDALTWLHME